MTRAGIAAVRWYRESGLEPAPSPTLVARWLSLSLCTYSWLARLCACGALCGQQVSQASSMARYGLYCGHS